MPSPTEVKLVPNKTRERLNDRQVVDYEAHREKMVEWLLNLGKDPDRVEGYALETVKGRIYRIDRFYRFVWDNLEDGYTKRVTTEHADKFMEHLAYSDHANSYKSQYMKALKMLFKWRHHQFGEEDWGPEITFYGSNSTTQPRDFFTKDERSKIRKAALEYGSIPTYSNLSPEERDKWKAHLAQRFEKPKEEVTESDWSKANGWKTPSLVWTSLDAGLRPIEVARATTQWVDTENGLLRIPKEDSSKNTDNWIVGLRDETSQALRRWLKERENHEKYSDTDKIWLTRNGNPYSSNSLSYLLENLCEIADIPQDNRQISWYTIRHSVGTYMTREEDLAAAQAQLRHKSQQTTMRYDQAPVEDRKEALNKMG